MLKSKLQVSVIAAIAHAINAAYCESLGDDSQKPWDEAPEWQKESAIAGVNFLIENPDAPVSATHDSWSAQKLADGWVYGEEKDEEAKTHPCLVPFDELPQEQKAKDYLFKATVAALVGLPVEPEAAAVAVAPVRTVASVGTNTGLTPVQYIGVRQEYTDGTYGTKITWKQGETKLVPTDKAILLLKHKDVYAEGEAEGAESPVITKVVNKELSEEEVQAQRDAVANMNLEALRAFAFNNFAGHKLHHKLSEASARQAVIGLIDQYGVSQ